MRCPICDALNREHSLMCEVEATMVLQQRYRMMNSPEPDLHELDKDSRDLVLMSRKRQAKIMSRLASHKAEAHSA
jgi:hypothetical protein